ncbi:hypothetical protein EDC04DRAFT_2661359 [Pisolithus marmoratus]|nr:hypothetical protein EDC04DRAFT_2661359 [Pisolithus marmoratus]
MVISESLGDPLSDEALAVLRQRFPDLKETWKMRHHVQTRLHAELRIILHFHEQLKGPRRHQLKSPLGSELNDPLSVQLNDPLGDQLNGPLPIGCSKRSCLCCTLWIDAYNCRFHREYLTSGSHGKPYKTWALPGSIVDTKVRQKVEVCLTRVLNGLYTPPSDQWSDDYRSRNTRTEVQLTKIGDTARGLYDEFLKTFKFWKHL